MVDFSLVDGSRQIIDFPLVGVTDIDGSRDILSTALVGVIDISGVRACMDATLVGVIPAAVSGAKVIVPALIAAATIAYSPVVNVAGSINQTISPAPIVASGNFPAPSVLPGAISVSPTFIAAIGSLFSPVISVGGLVVSPPAIAGTENTFQPTVVPGPVTVSPSSIAATGGIFAPVVSSGGVVISPPMVSPAEAIFAPAVSMGAVSIQPALIAAATAVPGPIMAFGAVSVAPSLIASSGAIYQPVLTTGSITISPSVIAAVTATYQPTVNVPATITPPVIGPSTVVSAPTLSPGAISVSPSLIASITVIPSPTLTFGATTISPALIAAATSVPSPVLTPGPITISPALVSAATSVPSPTVTVASGGTPVISYDSAGGYAGSVYTSTVAGQWTADGANIAGQTGSTWTMTDAYEGAAIKCGASNTIEMWVPTDAVGVTFDDANPTVANTTVAAGKATAIANGGASGNFTNSTTSSQPTYDATALTTANGWLQTATAAQVSVAGSFIFAVASVSGSISAVNNWTGAQTLAGYDNQGTYTQGFPVFVGGNVLRAGSDWNTPNAAAISTIDISGGGKFSAFARGSATDSQISVNGETLVTGANSINPKYVSKIVGRASNQSGSTWAGKIYRTLFGSGSITSADIARLQGWAKWKYGAGIVSGHTYASAPPRMQ